MYIHLENNSILGEYQRYKARIKLPKNRPGNWWSLTVHLPCKPPLFIYRNAYCIKSEAEKINRSTSYSLTQNKKEFDFKYNPYKRKIFDISGALFTLKIQYT